MNSGFLLLDVIEKIQEIKKNSEGISYLKRSRWTLSDAAYQAYKKRQQEPIKEFQDKY